MASEPINMSDPVPAIASTYSAESSNIVVYTIYNHVPGHAIPFILTGISPPVSRVKVDNDCESIIPTGPTSSCNIGIKIAPGIEHIGQTYNQVLTIDYYSPYKLTQKITFSVQPAVIKSAKLTISPSALTLAADGIPRSITITATEGDALAVAYESSASLPEGTTVTPAMCGDIAEGKSCVMTIHPGSIPSAVPGAASIPTHFKVQGINTNTIDFDATVLTQGNIYQQGYLYAIDDTTPANQGIGGTIVALSDNNIGAPWYNSNNISAGASSLTDGAANTNAIITAQNAGHYAASVCANYEIDSAGHSPCQDVSSCYKNWYLPAICQLGPETNLSGCLTGTANIAESLVKKSIGGFSSTKSYWSSTEFSYNPAGFAWYQYLGDGNNSFQSAGNKYIDFFAVRCVRAIS
jgi:hypothetical protein